jgi:hypothetical protein
MKKTALYFAIFLLHTALFSQVNLFSDLVICMPMNGNANDFSGNNNNGAVSGAIPCTDRFNNPNSAYCFNGINNYISVPNSISIDSIEAKDELTIAAWCYINNWYQSWNVFAIVNKYNPQTDAGWEYCIQAPVGCPEQLFSANVPQQQNLCAFQFPGSTTLQQWDFYTATYSKSQNMVTAYKNGVLTATFNINGM